MAIREQDLIHEIAENYSKDARQDATMNVRVSNAFLDEIKAAAKAEGFDKYQAWVKVRLQDAVNEVKGIKVEKFQ